MVNFTYTSGGLLKNPQKTLQKFSVEIMIKRDEIIEKLKGRRVKVMTRDQEIKECTFISADATHFTYKLLDDNKTRKTLLKNLILKVTD
tara:strand:+ start:1557 stop:1823 length:267 start_codon:yes stop_codon:yes gene_type:complete